METKVSEKWFEENGWTIIDNSRRDTTDACGRVTTSHNALYVLDKGNIKKNNLRHAAWNHHMEVTRDKQGRVSNTSNWYSFSCFGKSFRIESRISYRRFDIKQIESALEIVGLL